VLRNENEEVSENNDNNKNDSTAQVGQMTGPTIKRKD